MANRIIFFVMIAVLVLTVLVQANPGTNLPSRDYGFYIYIGEQIIHGKLPYRDAWDSKPPAVFYLNAVALRIGRGSRWGVWIVECAFLFGAIWLSFYLMRKLWGVWPAIFGVLIWLAGLDLTLQGGNFTEEYPLLFHFLALIIFMKLIEQPENRLNNIILGSLFSLSFLFRPNNASIEAMLILMLAFIQIFRRNARGFFIHTLWITLGVLPPILITVIYFWSQGLLQDLLEGSILHNLAYSSTSLTMSSSPLVGGFQFLKWSAWVGLIGYVAALFQIKKFLGSPSFYMLIFLLVGWPLMVGLSDPAGRNYGHYFMNWLPFIALSSGLALHTLGTKSSGIARVLQVSSPYAFGMVLILAAGYLVASGRATQYRDAVERVLNGPGVELRSPYSIYVENHTRPGEYVLFWATLPGENFMSNREAPYSTLIYPSLVASDMTKKLNDDFLQDITRNPPVLVVDLGRQDPLSLDPKKRAEQRRQGIGWRYPPDNLDEVFSFIESNYFLVAEIKGKFIYRLNGTHFP
jgi:hypothetical protein